MTLNTPWLQNYPAGVSANIDAEKYCSLLEFINEQTSKYENLPAVECFGKRLTYKELDDLSTKFAGYLAFRGLRPNDRIALMMPNLLQYPVALFGALKAGLIIVNTNPLYTAPEMEHQFNDSGVKAIVIVENFAHNLEKIIKHTDIGLVITTSIGELLSPVKGALINFVVKRIKRGVPKFNLPEAISFKQAINEGTKKPLPEFDNSPDRVIMYQYTGGTTGVAKGAMLTNRNIIANMMQMQAWLTGVLEEGKEIGLCPLPLYHIFAFSVNLLAMMSFGSLVVLVTNPRDIKGLVKEFKKNNISLMTGVNTLFSALLANEKFRSLDFSNLKAAMSGGTALLRPVAEEWEQVTGRKMVEGYGLTESSPVAIANTFDGGARIGSIGMPIPSTLARIMREDGTIADIGERGEVQLKGPQIMLGYYNRPEATAETIVDGWLCTGDIGIMQEDGHFKIVDRKKDMILVSGFNVYPNEIEAVVKKHPKVLEVAVIGIPDEHSGEVPKLFIVKKDKSLTDKEIIAFCRENLTGYKIPKSVEFRDDLPKSTVGKILRKELRK